MLAAEVDSKFQPTTRSSKLKRKVKVIFFYRRGSSAAEKKEKKKKKPSNAVGDIQIFFQMLFCFVLFFFFSERDATNSFLEKRRSVPRFVPDEIRKYLSLWWPRLFYMPDRERERDGH